MYTNYSKQFGQEFEILYDIFDIFATPGKLTANAGGLSLCVNVPGYNKYNVSVSYEGSILKIISLKEGENKKQLCQDRTLKNIDIPKIKAIIKDGVLNITLPFKKEVVNKGNILIE